MMKFIFLLLLVASKFLFIPAFFVWSMVEFCLYLFKDDPFNWTSLWCFIGSIVLFIVSLFVSLIGD